MNNMAAEMPAQLLATFNDGQIADITSFILANRENTLAIVRDYKDSGYAHPSFLSAASDTYCSPDDARRMLIGVATLLAANARDMDLDFTKIVDIAKRGTNLPEELIDHIANKRKDEIEFSGGMMTGKKPSGTAGGSNLDDKNVVTDGDPAEVGGLATATVSGAARLFGRGSRAHKFAIWLGRSKGFKALRRNKKWVKRGALGGLIGYSAFNTASDLFSGDEDEAAELANTVNWAFAAKLIALGSIIEEIMEKSRLLPASLEFAFPNLADSYQYEGGDPASLSTRDSAVYEAMRQALPLPFASREAGVFADAVERGDAVREACMQFAAKVDPQR